MSPKWSDFAPPPRDLTGDYKWNVFLSYRSVNRPWVLGLYDVLRELGHQVFIDQVVKAIDNLLEVLASSQLLKQALSRAGTAEYLTAVIRRGVQYGQAL